MGAFDEVKELVKSKPFDPKNLPLFLKAVEECAQSNEDLQDEIEDQEDVIILMEVPNVASAYLEIKDGKLTAYEGTHDSPTVTVKMGEDKAGGLLTGEIDTASAYMAGDIRIVGEMAKAMALRSIIEIVGEDLGLQMGR